MGDGNGEECNDHSELTKLAINANVGDAVKVKNGFYFGIRRDKINESVDA